MLISRASTVISSDTVPAAGEEVYDTVSGETFFGDGVKKVSQLTAVPISFKNLVTAYDADTGQLQINGIEMGDTGGRDLSSGVLTNGFVSRTNTTKTTIQRIGNIVHFSAHIDQTGGAPTAATMYTLPLGFRPPEYRYVYLAAVTSSSPATYRVEIVSTNGAINISAYASLTGIHFSFGTWTWTTADAWPTTLPGTVI